MPPLSPYRAVLRTPHASGAFVSSLVARLCYGMVGLSLLLTLTACGRDFGLAGLVMALFGVSIVLVSPYRAWMIDRYGPRRALPPMAAGFAALLTGLAGVLVSPGLATAYVLADSLASPRARNRAGNWVNSGYNAGNSAGAVLSGQLVGRIPLSACLPVLAAPALLAVMPLLLAPRRARRPAGPPAKARRGAAA